MRMIDIIGKKRDGEALSSDEIRGFIADYTSGDIPDYQTAALLMAIYFQGMSRKETVELTMAIAESGDQLDLHDAVPFIVDKHSSGGVGDKTTLVVQPIVAACGVPVGKMSGRGLGLTGGTLDKMEAFTGFSSALSMPQFKKQLVELGVVLAGQTAVLAPADGKLYALRDVTGTVASIPLIAASIMSKKLAAGADAIVLDVKTGSGAFMETLEDAQTLARIMVDIGNDAGRQTVAIISDMNQPLGHAVGNALEVKEALATLRDDNPPADFWAHCLEVAGNMLLLAGKADTLDAAKAMATAVRDDGSALAKFRQMVVAQGGDGAQVDNPDLLPQSPVVEPIIAPRDGVIAAMDTGEIGYACVHLGAGRMKKGDPLDYAAGFVLPCKIGDSFKKGDVLGMVHAETAVKSQQAQQEILAAISWSDDPVERLPHFYGLVS